MESTGFKNFGIMIDCSRNSVVNVPTAKKIIDLLSKMGYTFLQLYTEDTFEIDNNPYVGHQRGRYSQKDLKELDDYAFSKGIELIPCIQALAHLNGVLKWPIYKDILDCNDILLAGEEKTYAFLRDVIATTAKCFRSRKINIGMDEAHMVGLGKYLDKHGYENRFDIISKHLEKVCEITREYGYHPMMWSDMFFRLANGGLYESNGKPIPEEIKNLVPKDIELIYWNYNKPQKSAYDKMIKAHMQFNNEIWFAGGAFCWTGIAPANRYSINTLKASINACKQHGIENYIITMWGDDGGECSPFAVLPALFFASQYAKGITDYSEIQINFEKMFKIPFKKFLLLDLKEPVKTMGGIDFPSNRPKAWLYNDIFMGILDTTIDIEVVNNLKSVARSLSKFTDEPEYGYLFDCIKAYAQAVAAKAPLGIYTREAYQNKDKERLSTLLGEYKIAIKKIKIYHSKFYDMWMKERTPQGFDVQDIRTGAVIQRIESCSKRLKDYLDGKIDSIPELEEQPVDFWNREESKQKEPFNFNRWQENISPNVLSHLVFN